MQAAFANVPIYQYFCKITFSIIACRTDAGFFVLIFLTRTYTLGFKGLLILIFLLTAGFQTYAQFSPADSAASEEDIPDMLADSSQASQDYVPEDFIFIPSDVLYNNSWDNTNVRVRKSESEDLEDTIVLVLNHPSDNPFVFPVKGKFLSPFGYRGRRVHAGVDIKLDAGDPVYCAFDGKVRLARKYRGYGNIVVVRHFNGLETVYSHLSKLLVRVNDDVKAGDVLGLGGRTGRATTNHLHFETRFLGDPFDPQVVLDLENFKLKCDTLVITPDLFKISGKNKKKKGDKSASGGKSGSSAYHTIRKGDTLSQIAKQHRTTVQAICKLNKISKNKKLQIGKRLKVR